jgi:hypothetical protein
MAQTATGFGKKSSPAKPSRGEGTPREQTSARAIPLDLAPLLSRFEQHRRLSIRIERLHHLGHLSKGRNNGDNSWSLTPDELHELSYLLPVTVLTAHTLAVRIIDVGGGGGQTLTVLDVAVSPGPAPVASVPWDTADAANDTQPSGEDVKEALRQLEAGRPERKAGQDERGFASMDATLVIRRDKLWGIKPASQSSTGMLAAKGAAEPSGRASVPVDNVLLDQTGGANELQLVRERCQALQTALAEQTNALMQARAAAEQARELAKWESEKALAEAQKAWNAREAERLAVAEAQWREQAHAAAAQHANKVDAKELGQLREAFAALQDRLDAREQELTAARTTVEQTRTAARHEIERAVAEANTARQNGEAARLAASEAQWRQRVEKLEADLQSAGASARTEAQTQMERALAEARAAWSAEHQARFAAAEAQWREKSDGLETALQSATQAAGAGAQAQIEHALAQARTAWASEERARLAAAQAQWQATAQQASATADAHSEDLGRLREACAALQSALASRDTELSAARAGLEQARDAALAEADRVLLEAKADWVAGETARFAAAETEWREKLEQAVTARTQTDAAGEARATELRQLRETCALTGASLTARETELAEVRAAADLAQKRAQIDIEAARERALLEAERVLTESKKSWAAGEAARLAAAEAQWRKTTTRAEPDDTARDRELQHLRDEYSGLQARLAAREAETAQLQRESRDFLAQAEKRWKSDEAARLHEAEAQWRKRQGRAQTEAEARAEAAETALAQLRRSQSMRSTSDEDTERLRDELAAAQSALAAREAEIADLRAGLPSGATATSPNKIVLRRNSEWAEPEPARSRGGRAILRDLTIVAALAAATIVFYPNIAPYIPPEWRPDFAMKDSSSVPPAPAPALPAAAPAPQLPTATVLQGVNFRDGASTTAPVIATLPRGAEVQVVERSGNWTHIRVPGSATAPPAEGWVYTSYLQEASAAP